MSVSVKYQEGQIWRSIAAPENWFIILETERDKIYIRDQKSRLQWLPKVLVTGGWELLKEAD